MSDKPTLCLDFDGVIHGYQSGWKGVSVIPDPPVKGAEEFLFRATAKFKVCVFSSRSKSIRGRFAMKKYMRKHFCSPLTFSPDHNSDFLHEEIFFPWFKPPALVSIDDRGITFDGEWPDVNDLLSFRPWNRRD